MKTLSESIRCVNGCGNLTNDMHDYHSIKGRFVSILIGLMLIIIPVIITGLIIDMVTYTLMRTTVGSELAHSSYPSKFFWVSFVPDLYSA